MWTTLAALVCLALAIWMARACTHLIWCRHRGALGLLPPVTNPDGSRRPAHWFCDRCGATWPANLDRERRYVSRFDGYDYAKARDGQRRARERELAKRQIDAATRTASVLYVLPRKDAKTR